MFLFESMMISQNLLIKFPLPIEITLSRTGYKKRLKLSAKEGVKHHVLLFIKTSTKR